MIDRYTGTLSLLRVVSGTLRPDLTLLDATQARRSASAADAAIAGRPRGRARGRARRRGGRGELRKHTGHSLTAEKGGVRLREPIPQV